MQVRSLLAATFLGICSCSLSPADDDSRVFDNLTSHEWRSDSPGPFGHREFLRLRRNGEYHWEKTSDYLERSDKGTWSIVTAKDRPGLLRLSLSAEATFQIEKDKLFMGWQAFQRGERIKYGERESKLGLADLKAVKPSENFQKLTRKAWVKTNPFDDYRFPQQVEFDTGGEFFASFRDGTCRTNGFWQLVVESQGRFSSFMAVAKDRECGAGFSGDRLVFVDDLVLLGAPYAPIDKKPKRNIFIFDRYGDSVRTRGEFDGVFTKGRAIRIDLTHEGASIREYKLVSLNIGFQKCEIVKGGISPIGKMQSVVYKDLAETIVTFAKPHRQTVEFAPPLVWHRHFPNPAPIQKLFSAV